MEMIDFRSDEILDEGKYWRLMKNGNKYSKLRYESKDAALEADSSNRGCYHCIDCVDCVDCVKCENLSNSSDCYKCCDACHCHSMSHFRGFSK